MAKVACEGEMEASKTQKDTILSADATPDDDDLGDVLGEVTTTDALQIQTEAAVTSESVKSSKNTYKPSAFVIFLNRFKYLVLLGFLGLTIGLAVYGFGIFGVLDNEGFVPPDADSTITDRFFSQFSALQSSQDVTVLMEHPTWVVDDPQFREAAMKVKAQLTTRFPITKVIDYFDYSYLTGLTSTDNHMTIMSGKLPGSVMEQDGSSDPPYKYQDFVDATAGSLLKLTFAGNYLGQVESSAAVNNGLVLVELGSAPVLIVLLVLTFGGVVAIIPPILLIIWTVIMSFVCLRLVSLGFHVTTYVTNVCTIFGVGLGVDYCLFMNLRFREEMTKNKMRGLTGEDALLHAVSKTIDTSGRTVAFSAAMLAASLAGALQLHEYYASTMSLAIMFNALTAAIGAYTFIPTVYLAMGDKLFYLSTEPYEKMCSQALDWAYDKAVSAIVKAAVSTNPAPAATQLAQDEPVEALEAGTEKDTEKGTDDDATDTAVESETVEEREVREMQSTWLYKTVEIVMTNPLPFAIASSALFLALLAVFITQVRFANQDYGNLAIDSKTRYVAETVEARFPGSNGKASADVWLHTKEPNGIQSEAFVRALDSFSTLASAVPNVVSVTGLTTLNAGTSISRYIQIYTDPFNPQWTNVTTALMTPFGLTDFQQTTRLQIALSVANSDNNIGKSVRGLRYALEESFFDANGVKLLDHYGVTGGAAQQYDVNTDLLSVIPNVIAVIVVSMYVLVLLLTGSVLLPIKSIICAALSICASFGVLVLVVQEGNGRDLLRFNNNLRCLDPIQLIFIFVVAFGLSLDYEVFMLGRIQEIYEQTGDNKLAVCKGIATSARAVSLAAILLCAAVGGFLASDVLVLKQIAIGIGLTIVLDATIVRSIIVPSYMGLLPASWNWWAPVWIKRIVAFVDLKESSE